MSPWILIFPLLIGLFLLWLAKRLRTHAGLPQGRVVYSDTGDWNRPERPLFSQAFLLTGKPDYLVADGADVIPVEVKSCRAPTRPYPSHVLQLAAYCLLVEECHGRRPSHGIIKYADHTFKVDYTPELEQALLNTLDCMRADLTDGYAARNHNEPQRCRVCGYWRQCDQRLET